MTSPNHRWLGLGLAIFFSLNVFSPIQAAEKETVRIGLVQTMFTDVGDPADKAMKRVLDELNKVGCK